MRFIKGKLYKNGLEKDEYNQRKMGETYIKEIDIFFVSLNQNNTDDVRYKEATFFGLTPEKDVNSEYAIEIEEKKYKVLLNLQSRRLNQLWLKEML